MSRHRAAVVAGRGCVTGVVGDDIVVLPNMHPSHAMAVMQARGVVAEVGGALAHLAVVCREMVLPDACTTLTPGMRVTLDPARCEILVLDR